MNPLVIWSIGATVGFIVVVCAFIAVAILKLRRLRHGKRSSSEEFALSVRAGRQQLSPWEIDDLGRERHPLSMQLADPNTVQLIELFGGLPDYLHTQLEHEGFLKWSFAKLDAGRQNVVRNAIALNVELAQKQGGQLPPGMSIAALQHADTGFAVVDMPGDSQRVVSWFVLWSEAVRPMWVTVANPWPCGSRPYFQTHLTRLPALRSEKQSELPPGL